MGDGRSKMGPMEYKAADLWTMDSNVTPKSKECESIQVTDGLKIGRVYIYGRSNIFLIRIFDIND